MIHRTLLLAGVFAAFCFANPETIIFTGTADGDLNGQNFSNKKVTFTFLTDTEAIAPGTFCCFDNLTTPAGTQGKFEVEGVGSGTMTYTQGVFVNEQEGQMGIWFYDERDYFDILWPVGKYDLKSNYGPVTGTTFVFTQGPMFTTAGVLRMKTMKDASAIVTVSTTPAPKPVITAVTTAYGTGVSQNSWIAINGNNLVSTQTQAIGLSWVGPQPYMGGYMEPKLNGVTVSVNGKPAVISYYCSSTPAGSPCPAGKDQINALVALDSTTGPVQVVVTNGGVASDPFTVTMSAVSPALLKFRDNSNYVTATHANYSLLGPTSLYPGFSTPAIVGETVVLWAVGFGLPSNTLVANADTQSGTLPTLPTCTINNVAAVVSYAGLAAPGLYQINVVIPNGAVNGDNAIACSYGGSTTAAANRISVSR